MDRNQGKIPVKKLLIVIVLVAVTALVAPKFIGNVVQTEYQSALNKMAENPAIVINSSAYTIGWFSGKVVTDISILLHDTEVDDIKLIVEDNLSFGPVIFTDDGVKFALSYSQVDINFKELLLDEEIASFVQDKVQLTGLMTFSKDIVTTLVIDEITEAVDGNKVHSSQAVGEFVLEDQKRAYGEFNWGGLTVNGNEENVTVGATKFSFDQTLIAGDYYQGNAISTGDFNFNISAVNVNDATGNAILEMSNLAIGAIASVHDNLMKIGVSYGADEVKSAGQEFKNANLAIEFDKLDIETIQEVNAVLATLSVDGDDMFNAQNMQKLSPLLTKLLANEPVLAIKELSVETPEGKINSAMNMTIDKNVFDVNNMMSIMAALIADANGKAPMAFFTRLGLAPMVDMYVEQGLLLKNEQELSFTANFAQGQLQVNGQVIPL